MKPETLATLWRLIRRYGDCKASEVEATANAINAILSRHVEHPAETLAALRNMGHDVTCGACIEIAFTGITLATHTCECATSEELLQWLEAGDSRDFRMRRKAGRWHVALFPYWTDSLAFRANSTSMTAAIRAALRLAKETDNAD